MEQDYFAVLKIDNVLVILTTVIGVVAHAGSAPHAFLPFLRQLFEAARSDVATYPYLAVINNVAIDLKHPLIFTPRRRSRRTRGVEAAVD
jgi:hypothetical protein